MADMSAFEQLDSLIREQKDQIHVLNEKLKEVDIAASGPELVAGTNITLVPDASLNTLTINSTASGVGETIEPGTQYTYQGTTYTVGTNVERFNLYGDDGDGNAVNQAAGSYSHVEGYNNKALGEYSHAEGSTTIASGQCSHAEGYNNTISASDAHVEGFSNTVSGLGSHAEGGSNTIGANANSAHAEGYANTVTAVYGHVEGYSCDVYGANAHAEGCDTLATGVQSHAEGNQTQAHGAQSHAEGSNTVCAGTATSGHAEGHASVAIGDVSHAQNESTQASGSASTAMGDHSVASGSVSTALGYYTIANGTNQLALGRCNISDTNSKYAMIIGNGIDNSNRSDAFKVDWNGKIYVGDKDGVDVSGLNVTSSDNNKVLTASYQNGVGTYSWQDAPESSACIVHTYTDTSLPNKVVLDNNNEYRYINLSNASSLTISIETIDTTKSFYSTIILHNVSSTSSLSTFVTVSGDSVISNIIFLNEDNVDLSTADTAELLFFTNGMSNTVMCIAYAYGTPTP